MVSLSNHAQRHEVELLSIRQWIAAKAGVNPLMVSLSNHALCEAGVTAFPKTAISASICVCGATGRRK
jgi:hypothetical protein